MTNNGMIAYNLARRRTILVKDSNRVRDFYTGRFQSPALLEMGLFEPLLQPLAGAIRKGSVCVWGAFA